MSRIIKFRAWDGDKMHKAFDLSANPLYWWEKNYDFPLMQFTGLLDKNGVEIYEGDILLFKHDVAVQNSKGHETSNVGKKMHELGANEMLVEIAPLHWGYNGFRGRCVFKNEQGKLLTEDEWYDMKDQSSEIYIEDPIENTLWLRYLEGCKAFEVIGNIYENPELLEQPNEPR